MAKVGETPTGDDPEKESSRHRTAVVCCCLCRSMLWRHPVLCLRVATHHVRWLGTTPVGEDDRARATLTHVRNSNTDGYGHNNNHNHVDDGEVRADAQSHLLIEDGADSLAIRDAANMGDCAMVTLGRGADEAEVATNVVTAPNRSIACACDCGAQYGVAEKCCR